MELSNVIKKPLITEKTMSLATQGKYTFCVDKKTNKGMVKKAIEEFFKVKVKKVWLSKVLGKTKRVGRRRRHLVKQSDWKKAIVQLKEGQKIDLFEEVSKKSRSSSKGKK